MNITNNIKYFSNNLLLIFIYISVLCIYATGAEPKKHGTFAQKLDEYYSTIKCLANIMEDLVPESNTLMMCCGVWLMHDWMGSMVLDNCYEHNYHQVNNLTKPFIRQMEETCFDYPKDSFSCKLMIITPITLIVIFFILIILLSVCAIVTCIRLRRYQRFHDYQTSQGFDSAGTEETTDEPTAPSIEKKKPIDV